MAEHRAWIEGIGIWAPTLPDWPAACMAWRGGALPPGPGARLPAPGELPPAERRRAPASVALALEAARQAVTASGRPGHELLSVFTSAHGDQPVIDQLCQTLAEQPLLVSPTRFIHSIHNAASGAWSQVHACHRGSTAISAGEHSFAHGLLEALVQCTSQRSPVLLVAFDTAAAGPLAQLVPARAPMAVALVLAAEPLQTEALALDWQVDAGRPAPPTPVHHPVSAALAEHGMAAALPLLEVLAGARPGPVGLPLDPRLTLSLRLQPSASTCHPGG